MFEGIRRSYTLLTLLLMEIIEELGTDRALEMLQDSVEKQGITGMIRRRAKDLGPGFLLESQGVVHVASAVSRWADDPGEDVHLYEDVSRDDGGVREEMQPTIGRTHGHRNKRKAFHSSREKVVAG